MTILTEFKEYAMRQAKGMKDLYSNLNSLELDDLIKQDRNKAEFLVQSMRRFRHDYQEAYHIETTLEEEEFWDKLLTELSKRES